MSVRKVKRRYPGADGMHAYWMVDVVYEPLVGEPVRVRRKAPVQTRAGALRYEREVRAALASGAVGGKEERREVPTLEKFSGEFVDNYAVANNRPSEVASKRMILRTHLVPELGPLRLDEIGPRQVEQYKAKKLGDDYGANTINHHLRTLSRLLVIAAEWKIIDHAPRIALLKEPPLEFDFLDLEEADRLLEACRKGFPEHFALLHTVLKTGMRTGEFLALRWPNVDLVAGRIRVCENFVWGEVLAPKNNKVRVIEIGNDAVAVLKEHRHLRSDIVFCAPDGTMQTRDDIRRPLERICDKAGLRHVTWRDLRHTFASHLVMLGAPIKTVQEMLGHADIKMTMRYAHLSPVARRDAAKLLDRGGYGSMAAAKEERASI